MPETTPPAEDSGSIRRRYGAATTVVQGLARGTHKWRMRVPAQPGDSDLVITAALDDIPRLLAERDRLAAQIAAAIRTAREALIHADPLCRYHADTPPAHPPWHGGCDSCKQPTRVRTALAAIDTAQRASLTKSGD